MPSVMIYANLFRKEEFRKMTPEEGKVRFDLSRGVSASNNHSNQKSLWSDDK